MTSIQTTQLADNAQNVSGEIDLREQLFNEGVCGQFRDVQVSTERITSIRAIFQDLDIKFYRESSILPTVSTNPTEFYHHTLADWLSRHPVLKKAEARNSGTGIHVLLWLSEPITFESDAQRNRWGGIVKTVQAALPIDPDQPTIIGLTRPVGSINSKNGAKVTRLRQGEPISTAEILAFSQEMQTKWFRTVMTILTGQDRLTPCPLCRAEKSNLWASEKYGKCYGSCGKVKIEQLYDLILRPRQQAEA